MRVFYHAEEKQQGPFKTWQLRHRTSLNHGRKLGFVLNFMFTGRSGMSWLSRWSAEVHRSVTVPSATLLEQCRSEEHGEQREWLNSYVHSTEGRKIVLDRLLVLTQLVNHEMLKVLGLYILSHIMQGSCQNQAWFSKLLGYNLTLEYIIS